MPSFNSPLRRQTPMNLMVPTNIDHRRRLTLSFQPHGPDSGNDAGIDTVRSLNAHSNSARQPASLDIRVPDTEEFDAFESIDDREFFVVFVTARSTFGMRAEQSGPRQYQLKPVDIDTLNQSVARSATDDPEGPGSGSSTPFVQPTGGNPFPQKIVLPTNEGLIVEVLENIVRLESDNYYTTVVRRHSPKILLAKTLKEFEAVLDRERFVRVHNSHIINMEYLEKFDRRDGGYVIMGDGSRIPVSRRRQSLLLEKLKAYNRV